MSKKKTIKTIVLESKDLLKNMSYIDLIDWGKRAGFDNRQAFTRYKKALGDIDIDFNTKKYEHRDSANEYTVLVDIDAVEPDFFDFLK